MSLITYTTVAYPDLQDNEEGEGGGGRGHPDPEIRRAGAVSKFFSALRASVWPKKKGGRLLPWIRHCTTSLLVSILANIRELKQRRF